MKKNRIKKRTLRQIFPLIFFVLLLVYCISLLIPMAWALMSSLKSRLDFRMDPLGFPTSFAWENYVSAFNALYIQVSAGAGVRNVYLLEMFGYTLAYAVGATIAATALIPILGAYLGAAIGAFMIFTVNPLQALGFIVFIVVLQQIEGNVIYPKTVGSSIGLPGIWVIAAVTVGGGFAGIPGMLLGVPLAASVYQLIRDDVHRAERKKKVVRAPQIRNDSDTPKEQQEPIQEKNNFS